ncbi:MAG: hypothetical protein ACPL4E_02875 [Thermoproteota archaeon]
MKDDRKRLWLWAINLSNHEDPFTRRYASRVLAGYGRMIETGWHRC